MNQPVAEPTRDDLRAAGRERRRLAQGAKADALDARLRSMDAGMANLTNEFVFGQVWGRPGLSHEERMLVAIGALVATEHPNQLRNYLHGALQNGIDPIKVHETIVMMCVYGGFPAALEGLMEWRDVVRAARKQGMEIDLPIE
jgi:4-carboxymuconolactone decarboxylase